ncbi:MAG TPA: A24 family peptidase [Usitatibacter sp.]|jgi:leader peptidase (prepilin peptidase)/N-methyltransferase
MTFLDILRDSPGWLYVTVSLLGLCVGSLLNVVIHRLPKMMEAGWREECAELEGRELPPRETYNLFTPRSACPKCGTPITALQNIPVASWLALRGKCAKCANPISIRYPAVEVLGALAALLMAWRFGYSGALAFAMIYGWAMIALAFIDFDTQLLPDDITLPLLWLGLIANAFGTFTDLRSAVLGAVGGYMILWLVYWAFRILAKKEGMGYGDFKLLGAIGAWTGWQVLPVVIIASAGLGAVIGSLALWLARKGTDTRIPFGPYLALGGIAGLVWGKVAVIMWLGHFPA